MVMMMMRRYALAGLVALLVPACGLPSVRPLTGVDVAQTAAVRAGDSQIQGAYLSVDLRPNLPLYRQARDLRMRLGFVDMGQALPPRSPGDFHITVAYFQNLSRNSAQKLAELYQHKTADIQVTGWGNCQNQAAYFTLKGIEPHREQIRKALPEHFSADDPHVTFGVHPGKPKDLHGVPKPLQNPLPPLRAVGDLHLKQGDNILW
jgi:hypothetical protein